MITKTHPIRLLLCIALAWATGCAEKPASPPTAVAPSNSVTDGDSKPVSLTAPSITSPAHPKTESSKPLADQALNFAKRYQSAKSYQEEAVLTLSRLLDDGRVQETETKIEARVSQPNRLFLRIKSEENSVIVASQGQKLTARIVDPITDNFHGQTVVRTLPAKLTLGDIYGVTELIDPIAPEEMLSALLAVPAGLDVLPFSLLLQEGKLTELVKLPVQAGTHRRLGIRQLPSGERCETLSISAEEGAYEFWVHDHVLRRIVMPPLTKDLLPGVKQLSLTIDLDGIDFKTTDQDFPRLPSGIDVRHFVLPPVPPITDLLGREVRPLQFFNQNGQEVRVANDSDQTTVLVWFGNRPESRLVMQAIEQVRRRNRSDRVRLAAVAAETSANPSVLESWNVETAWLRDRDAIGRDVLGIDQAPTVVVLGPKNRLDYFEVGANPNIGADVALVLERLLVGQNVAEVTLSMYRDSKSHYDRALARAKLEGDGWIAATTTALPKAAPPKILQAKSLWRNTEIKEPGNMLLVPGKQQQLMVLDGWSSFSLLDLNGKTNGKVRFDLPKNEGVSMLRAASNGRDRALVAAASRGGRQAFLFDFAGKRLAAYPPEPGDLAISDILVHNIAKGDEPELLVSWQGDGGLHAAGLTGDHHWTNQAAANIISIAAAQAPEAVEDRPIVVATGSGTSFLIGQNGRTLRELRVGQVVHQLACWPGPARGFETILHRDDQLKEAGFANYLGIASSALGGFVVTGIQHDWNAIWTQPLPPGVFQHQVDFPQSVTIPRVGPTWIVPGPDGSLHFLSADGNFRDRMYLGSPIRGLAATSHREQAIVLVSTSEAVTAIQLNLEE